MLILEEQVPRKPRLMSLYQVRLGLGMSQQELSNATESIVGHRVHRNIISACEQGKPIKELTAMRLLMTINALYKFRNRPLLSLDDLTWIIIDRKLDKE